MINELTGETARAAHCRQCDREIQLGEDAFEIEQGVIGPRGFVPLEATVPLCSEACARGYFGDTDEQITRLKRRVP